MTIWNLGSINADHVYALSHREAERGMRGCELEFGPRTNDGRLGCRCSNCQAPNLMT